MSDEVEVSEFSDGVKSGDERKSLIAIRDYLVHELEVNRCQTCLASKLRTGDTAALVLRLTTVLKEIQALPKPDEGVSKLDELRARRSTRQSPAKDSAPPHGTKNAQRRSGSHRPGGERWPAS